MKSVIVILISLYSTSLLALGVSCGDSILTFKHESGAYFDLCPTKNSDFEIYAYSRGGKTHSCNLEATAIKTGSKYIAKDMDCKVSFSIAGDTLSSEFSRECKMSFCGMRAQWVNGEFTK